MSDEQSADAQHLPATDALREAAAVGESTPILAEIVEPPTAGKAANAARMYVVPQRFGMSAMLGIMTALAVLFGILRRLDAYPFTYLFLGVLALVICLVQMCFGGVPRLASVAAGTIVFALFVLGVPFVMPRVSIEAVLCLFVCSLPCGGLLGYLTGTCAAGIFLVMDYFEQFLLMRRSALADSSPATGNTQ